MGKLSHRKGKRRSSQSNEAKRNAVHKGSRKVGKAAAADSSNTDAAPAAAADVAPPPPSLPSQDGQHAAPTATLSPASSASTSARASHRSSCRPGASLTSIHEQSMQVLGDATTSRTSISTAATAATPSSNNPPTPGDEGNEQNPPPKRRAAASADSRPLPCSVGTEEHPVDTCIDEDEAAPADPPRIPCPVEPSDDALAAARAMSSSALAIEDIDRRADAILAFLFDPEMAPTYKRMAEKMMPTYQDDIATAEGEKGSALESSTASNTSDIEAVSLSVATETSANSSSTSAPSPSPPATPQPSQVATGPVPASPRPSQVATGPTTSAAAPSSVSDQSSIRAARRRYKQIQTVNAPELDTDAFRYWAGNRNKTRSDDAAKEMKSRHCKNVMNAIKNCGNQAQRALVLHTVLNHKDMLEESKTAGYFVSEEVQVALFFMQQMSRMYGRATETAKLRGRTNDDQRAFAETIELAVSGSPDRPGAPPKAVPPPSKQAMGKHLGIKPGSVHRKLRNAEAKRKMLTDKVRGILWSQVKRRIGHKKVSPALLQRLFEWILLIIRM